MIKANSFTEISIASGYWDLPGMVEIYDELSFFSNEIILPSDFFWEETRKILSSKNPSKQDQDFPEKYLKKDLEELQSNLNFKK